jgi:zinc transporter ZupT
MINPKIKIKSCVQDKLDKGEKMRLKKSQSIIESTLAFAAGMAILSATVGLWAWGLAELGIKQGIYEGTRIPAMMQTRYTDENGAKPAFKWAWWPLYY